MSHTYTNVLIHALFRSESRGWRRGLQDIARFAGFRRREVIIALMSRKACPAGAS